MGKRIGWFLKLLLLVAVAVTLLAVGLGWPRGVVLGGTCAAGVVFALLNVALPAYAHRARFTEDGYRGRVILYAALHLLVIAGMAVACFLDGGSLLPVIGLLLIAVFSAHNPL